MGISGLPSASLGIKCHLDVAPMESYRVYYKGEGGGFPRVWVVVSLVSPRLHVACPNTTCRNLEKSHLDVGPVKSHIVYYKGEGGAFPQVRAVVSLVCPCCP